MPNTEQTERNWRIWHTNKTSGLTLRLLANHFNVGPERIRQITAKLDRRFDTVLHYPTWPVAKEARACLSEVHLEIHPELPDGSGWVASDKPLFNPWTGQVLPGTGNGACYYRVAPKVTGTTVTIRKPQGFVEPEEPIEVEEEQPITDATRVDDLPLLIRTINCLKNNGYHTLGAIRNFTEAEMEGLLAAPNFGKVSLQDLRTFIYRLRGEQPPEPEQVNHEATIQKLRVERTHLKKEIEELKDKVQREYDYVNKLKNILAKMAKDYTIGELRDLGVIVDARILKDRIV